MPGRLLLASALVAFAVGGAGCSCGPPPVTETPDAGEFLVECTRDEDCALGESCVSGKCERFAPHDGGMDASLCVEDTDCPSGLVCLKSTGVCVEPTQYDAGEYDAGVVGECNEGDTRPCGQSKLGECQLGVETCVGGEWGACMGAVLPTSEGCDNKDNDCDGVVDDGYDKLVDPQNCGTCGKVCSYPFATALCANGACAMGPCDQSHWDLNNDPSDGCEYACAKTNGGTETCDGLDNDCDGATDEDLGTTTCGMGACVNTVTNCVSGQPQICSPKPGSAEVCDGVDNDCNGTADDGLMDLSCGQGECFRKVAACLMGQPQTCTPGAPSAELCDTKDNDCDGQVDEGCLCVDGTTQSCYSGPQGTAGVGVCTAGTQTCSNGAWSACSGEVVPSAETCNAKDDDCDGQVDQGLGTTTCGVGECTNTVQNCSGGTTQTCSPKPASTEVCDSKDNDCDGLVDEALGTTTCGTGACQVTVQNCVNGSGQLCTPGAPTTEVCDGVDNDCDGQTDESYPEMGQSCSTGLLGPCGTGAKVCSMGAITCQQTVAAAPMETCNNNVDDDCNGTVDDPTQCGCNTAIDQDADGANECIDCNDRDGTIKPGATESCNGKDDNCDKAIDEGFDADGDGFTTCGTIPGGGVDPARIDCNDQNAFVYPGKVADCGGATTPNSPNMVDDNCNGYVDETCNCSTADADGDGVTECAGDCNDSDSAIFPNKTEVCDGKDNDCNTKTIDNCGVSEACGYKQGSTWTRWPAGTDQCRPDLICTSTIDGSGKVISMQCGSFCNQTPGAGLGDSCATGEACRSTLIDSDNLHLCSVTPTGTATTGGSCGADSDCRSGWCAKLVGPGGGQWCADGCTHESGCSANTTCFATRNTLSNGGSYYSSYCRLDSTIGGTKTLGQTCTGSDCKAGAEACFNGKCTQPCCEHADCGSGYACSLNGPGTYTGYVDSQNRQIYSLLPSCLASGAAKVSGQACGQSSECRSGICDKNLGICVDVCCSDASCPNGTTCEPVDYLRADGKKSFIRACVFSPVPAIIEQK